MHAVRQSMRPKHQVLVLKCYPRYQKNVAEVKPNSSELSYLLYYASTRRSKIQKVGSYLEKKTGSDVSRGKTGNVQVTLQILRALIDKSPRDLPLYAPYVLRIFLTVLRSKDVNMVEDSVPTFETFCEHQDLATLSADQELAKYYEEVVKSYTSFAFKPPSTSKAPLSTPIAIRWKSAGLRAIKSMSSSEAIGADGGRLLSVIMPVILENLYSDDAGFLVALGQKAGLDKEPASRRRMSVNTVWTADNVQDAPRTNVSETTADADRQAKEEAALLALQSLKQIFSANNRLQIRAAITDVFKFLMKKSLILRPETATSVKSGPKANWPTALIEMVTIWTPVQDRFIIALTAVETLVRSPNTEENLKNQIVIARLLQWLLGSTINMIGLSIMDILLGLVQHILVLLQLGGKGANMLQLNHRTSAIDLFKDDQAKTAEGKPRPPLEDDYVSSPSAPRQELLICLQNCIANLATHIYYGDQISDILTAILARLKPSPASGLAGATAAIEKPAAAAQAISESANMKEDPSTDEFFSFGTARVTALNAVKEVLVIANKRGASVGAGAVGRNKVTVRVWEGTQWLLRDEDRRVRRAYVDALLTWLQLEMNKKDLRIMEEKTKPKRRTTTDETTKTATSIARAASNASRGSRAKPLKTTFLQLLHLAVYDNALESPEDDSDILLMHLLLTSLVEKLGVNAVKSGLPMIIRLQDDLNSYPTLSTPKAKVNVGSLVYGYLLYLSHVFEFETTMPGYEIQSEVTKRQNNSLWLSHLEIPSPTLDRIIVSATNSAVPFEIVENDSLKPFESLAPTVNQIAIAYSNDISAQPSSPPQSPGRAGQVMSPITPRAPADELPSAFKESLLARWSKEACIASIEKDSAGTISPHGSHTGTTRSTSNGFLAANGHSSRDVSPAGALLEAQQDPSKTLHGILAIQTNQNRRSSAHSGPPTSISSSDALTPLRVDDLKRVLAGGSLADALGSHGLSSSIRNGSPLRNSSTAYQDFGNETSSKTHRANVRPSIISTGSDSVVDAEGFESASEGDLNHPLPTPQTPLTSQEIAQQYVAQLGRPSYEHDGSSASGTPRTRADSSNRPPSRMSRARSNSSASAEDPEANAKALKGELVGSVVRGPGQADEEVPPVPPLPQGIVAMKPQTPQTPHFNSSQAISPIQTSVPPLPTSDNTAPGANIPTASSTTTNVNTGANNIPSIPKDGSIGRATPLSNRSSIGGNRSSLRAAASAGSGAGDRRTLMQALLGSIEVDADAGKGSTGVGRPPY